MSRIKLSFSLIVAILLVGILSTAAFAKDPYNLKVAQGSTASDITVTFTNNTAAGEDATTQYDLYVKDPTGTDLATAAKGITVSASPVTVSGLTIGTAYQVILVKAGADPAAGFLSKTSYVVSDSHNNSLPSVPNASVDVYGTTAKGLVNANHTGYDNPRKNRSGQKIHGFYQNNTNSCASCHQTHTAANGESLLFKDGVYSTCSACHDGTTGAYNNFSPASSSTAKSIDGTFNVQATGHNGSLHEADGSLDVSAAPGGNHNPSTTTGSVGASTWGQEFDCASCHAAHGAGSSGENNLNIDPQGWGAIAYTALPNGVTQTTATPEQLDSTNGKLFKGLTINTSVPTDFSTPYVLVKSLVKSTDLPSDKTKAGYLWTRAGVQADQEVIQTYRWDGHKYVADYSLWLRDIGHVNAPFQNANTVLFGASNADLTTNPATPTGISVIWKDGFAFGSAAAIDAVQSANISIGIDVETTSDIASLYDSTDKNYIVDSGTEMSKYCAACHTDYLSTTRTNDTGVYTVAHRHATAQDRLTCVRCHYAHGSEATIMHDANDNTYFSLTTAGKVFDTTTTDTAKNTADASAALSYFVDPNPSSALKRYTGMSVCYACHGKGEQFLGNPNVTGDTTTGETLKNGDPGVVGTTGTNPGDGRTTISH